MSFTRVCLFVYLSVCPLDYSESYKWITGGGVGRGSRNNRLVFGGDPDHNPDHDLGPWFPDISK